MADLPIAEDDDADRKADNAYWAPAAGAWNVRFANGTTTSQPWGASAVGDLPLWAPPAYLRSHL